MTPKNTQEKIEEIVNNSIKRISKEINCTESYFDNYISYFNVVAEEALSSAEKEQEKQISKLEAEKRELFNWLKRNEFEDDNWSKKPRKIEKMMKVSAIIKYLEELEKEGVPHE